MQGGTMFDLFEETVNTSWLDEAIEDAQALTDEHKLA